MGGGGAAPGLKGLWYGLLAYRWATFAWMTVLAVASRDELHRSWLAAIALAGTAVWIVWLTTSRGWERRGVLAVDLAIAAVLLVLSGLVMAPGSVGRGAPFFATAYPVSAAMAIATARGVRAGLLAAAVLCVALAASRAVNGLPLAEIGSDQSTALANGMVYYLSAAWAVGLVSRTLQRSAEELRTATEEAARQRERAARLAERESLGREIHDSVLQALAIIAKRGRELAGRATVAGEEVRDLVELAGQQERALRSLIQRPPDDPPPGTVPIRTVLEAAAFRVRGLPVSITTVDPVWLPSRHVEGLEGALRQALENAAHHANASQVSVFAERTDGEIVVTVRDDGVGFLYDEERLLRDGKLGLLKSMKGRIEELGGSMRLDTEPGRGTEVEFRLPTGGGEG